VIVQYFFLFEVSQCGWRLRRPNVDGYLLLAMKVQQTFVIYWRLFFLFLENVMGPGLMLDITGM
jgi:hypothetical protein